MNFAAVMQQMFLAFLGVYAVIALAFLAVGGLVGWWACAVSRRGREYRWTVADAPTAPLPGSDEHLLDVAYGTGVVRRFEPGVARVGGDV